jgi:predicted MFS family arabinose efflux permease
MTAEATCPKCGAKNAPEAAECAQCKAPLGVAPKPRETFLAFDVLAHAGLYWNWVGLGTVIILAIQTVLGLTVVRLILHSLGSKKDPWFAWLLVLLVAGVGYFVGGLIVGRYSKGTTVREPALASILAALINYALSAFAFGTAQRDATGLIVLDVTLVICAALGYVGGVAGEDLQRRAWEKREEGRKAGQAPP